MLWKKRLPMAFEFSDSHSRYPKQQMVNEAIVGVTPCPTTRIPERSELPQVAMIAATADPRYRKAIAVYGLYTGKSFAEVIRLAILTLTTPDGVDNLDAFRQMLESFTWQS